MGNSTPSPRPHKAKRSPACITLLHATPRRNLRSIFRLGLRPDRARGRLKCTWLHSRSLSRWAIAHVARRHGVAPGDVIVLEIQLPRAGLRRRGRGIWLSFDVVSSLRIVAAGGLRLFVA